MYKGKKIIGIIGRTCSGKTMLLNSLDKQTKCFCINLDEIDTGIRKRERMWIVEKFGINVLESKTIKVIKNTALKLIQGVNVHTVAIEGIKLKKYFDDIVDVYIEFDVSYEERLYNSKCKNWTTEKFKFIDELYCDE